MTPSQLAKVEPGKFVGEYKLSAAGGDKTPMFAIREGRLPKEVSEQIGLTALKDAEIYKFEPPVMDGENGTLAVAAIEDVKKEEDGHVAAHLQFAVGGGHTALHTSSLSNPLLEGRSRFSKVFSLLTEKEGVDRLYMSEHDTNLTREEMRFLGFSTVANSDMLKLDLEPVAA